MLISLNPYKWTINNELGSYLFITDYGILYEMKFSDTSIYIQYISPLFDFSIYADENTFPSNNNVKKYKPKDNRVSDTICAFLLKAFNDNKNNCVSFTCESLDLKHKARHKLFNNWYERLKKDVGFIEKHDYLVEIEATNTYMTGSLFIHSNNENKSRVLDELSYIINFEK